MPRIEVLSSDPGRDARVADGARILVIRNLQRTPDATAGEAVGGIVGSPTNDRGVPNVPVQLSGVQDIFSKWGGFSPYVGDYSATPRDDGYNGNLAALLWRLKVKRPVLIPADMALKDKTQTDATAVPVKARLVRGALAFTVTIADEVIACPGHQFELGDTFQFITLNTATGASVDTTYEVIAPVVAGVSFKAKTPGGSDLNFATGDGSGVLRPVSIATPEFDATVVRAGTRIANDADGSTVVNRLLEDVSWALNEYEPVEVRVANVSGTSTTVLTGVETFLDAPDDTTVALHTVDTTAPALFNAAEIVKRYQAALDSANLNAAGKAITLLIADRTEAAIGDALATHCSEATSAGNMRRGFIAPPIGTTAADAVLTTGDGIDRTTLDTAYVAGAFPEVRRRFDLDTARLSAADDYKAPFPAHALLWARTLAVRPEENPTATDAEPSTTYGAAEVALSLTPDEETTLFRAGWCVTKLERHEGRSVVSWRDGIMADGEQIARARLTDFVTALVIERAVPWHKRLATEANREGLVDSVETALEALKAPPGGGQERIDDYVVTPAWDAEVNEMQLIVQVLEVGNLNVITIPLTVGASGVSVLGGGLGEG